MHSNRETNDNHRHHCAPSFNSYSTNNLAQIAARVTAEVSTIPENRISAIRHDFVDGNYDVDPENNIDNDADDYDDGSEFEFDLVNFTATDRSEIGTVYPVFDLELLKEFGAKPMDEKEEESRVMIQLKKLFIKDDDDREPPCSSSSSEAGELDGVPPESYCVWTPRMAGSPSPSPSRCPKSNSTGSKSKPWRLRDLLLLKRSKSDVSKGLVLLTPTKKKVEEMREKTDQTATRDGNKRKSKMKPTSAATSTAKDAARGVYYGRGSERDGNKRKSYLPYRRDLVGFLTAPQGLRIINFQPF
ncbi:hypothetical protein Ancab_004009 [Ancistrocladus abbreviatus]